MEEIKRLIDRYLLSAFFVIAGMALLIFGSAQNSLFLYGGLASLVAGILSILYVLGMINKATNIALAVLLFGGSCAFAFMDYTSISSEIELREEVTRRNTAVKQRLIDIRTAQIAHKKRFGAYAKDFDKLGEFIKNDSVMIVYAEGQIPEAPTQAMADTLGVELYTLIEGGVSEEQAFRLALNDSNYTYIRDTTWVSAENKIFPQDSLTLSKRVHPYDFDSIAYIPFTGKKFKMETDFIEKAGGRRVPVILVEDIAPYSPRFKAYMFGSLDDGKTNGNWGE